MNGSRRPRRICVFTATRAEYGVLYWLLRELHDDARVRLQLVVSGAHLSPQHGDTWQVIEADGFSIDAKVHMLLGDDSPTAVIKSAGLGMIGYADTLERLQPDIAVIVGDRYEALAFAHACVIAGVEIAHIAGGETTEGAIDDAFRNAITQLASLHFVAAEPFRDRLVTQLGVDPSRIHTVGAPSLDNIRRLRLLDRDALEAELGIRLRAPLFSVSYHPVTREPHRADAAVAALLEALDAFPQATVVFTMPNADPGYAAIAAAFRAHVDRHPERMKAFPSLGQQRYLSLLRHADVVIGNSSSGLIEAPAVGTPTVNIGNRQKGRVRAPTVLDSSEPAGAIVRLIRVALSYQNRRRAEQARSPYGPGRAAATISRVLSHRAQATPGSWGWAGTGSRIPLEPSGRCDAR